MPLEAAALLQSEPAHQIGHGLPAHIQPSRSCGSLAITDGQRLTNQLSAKLLHLLVIAQDTLRITIRQFQVRQVDDRALAQRHGDLENVAQLPDIARPMVSQQPLPSTEGQCLARSLDEMIGQNQNITLATSQRR